MTKQIKISNAREGIQNDSGKIEINENLNIYPNV